MTAAMTRPIGRSGDSQIILYACGNCLSSGVAIAKELEAGASSGDSHVGGGDKPVRGNSLIDRA